MRIEKEKYMLERDMGFSRVKLNKRRNRHKHVKYAFKGGKQVRYF